MKDRNMNERLQEKFYELSRISKRKLINTEGPQGLRNLTSKKLKRSEKLKKTREKVLVTIELKVLMANNVSDFIASIFRVEQAFEPCE